MMKTKIKITLCITSLLLVITLRAQVSDTKMITRDDSVVHVHIQDREIEVILNRILPNVGYEFHYIRDIVPCSRSFALKYQGEIYTLNDINKLLMVIKYSEDSLWNASAEDMIKAFVYLSQFSSITNPYQNLEFQIDITNINKQYRGELLTQYQRIGFNNLSLNYHCSAKLKDIKRMGVLVEWNMDFNIDGSEFISMVGSKVNSGIEDKRFKHFYVFENSAEMEKYEPTGRENTIKYLQEHKKEF